MAGRVTSMRSLAVVAFALGCAVMLYRGPVRALTHGGYDSALVYAAAKAWLGGGNPYESEPVSAAWARGGGDPARDPMKSRTREVLLYPPTALAVLSPWSALPWRAASVVWVGLNVVLLGATVLGAAALAGLKRGTAGWRWMAAGGVWLAPFHTCITHGQTAIFVTVCIIGGIWARSRGRSAVGGVLLGLGAAVKPQLAALFLVYEAGRMRWRTVAFGAAAVVVLTAVGIGRMEVSGAGAWRESWMRNVGEFAAGGDGRPTPDNPLRHHLVNLHVPLHEFTDDVKLVTWMVYGIVGILCGAYAWVDWRSRRAGRVERGPDELVSLSMVAVVSLLVVYHRFYDATLLVLALAMAVVVVGGPGRWGIGRWLPLVLLVPFFANSGVIAGELARREMLPTSVTASWLWRVVVMPHPVWCLLAMGLWLVVRRARGGPEAGLSERESRQKLTAGVE